MIASSNNLILRNQFKNKSLNQAIASGTLNVWDNGEVGNYWSDYQQRYPKASEADGSGTWDTPDLADENNVANYPLISEHFSAIALPLLATLVVARAPFAGKIMERRTCRV